MTAGTEGSRTWLCRAGKLVVRDVMVVVGDVVCARYAGLRRRERLVQDWVWAGV